MPTLPNEDFKSIYKLIPKEEIQTNPVEKDFQSIIDRAQNQEEVPIIEDFKLEMKSSTRTLL